MNILFSPIGLTDPISNFRDGAMLHICRNYPINKVYLYFTNEIVRYHEHDNRYLYCLDKLSKLLDRKIDYEIISKNEMIDEVHIFDIFIEEYRKELNEIHKKYPESTIYLNVSSGTPAMKSALQIISAFREFDFIPVQVSTPEKMSNPHIENKKNYNPVDMWDCNEDNIKNINRCTESKNINFIVEIKKKNILELIKKFDYYGAYMIAQSMKSSLSVSFYELLNGALQRYMLNCNEAKAIFKKYGYNIFEIEQSNYIGIYDYFLLLKLKVDKGEYVDFIRGITPLLADLFENILENKYKFKVGNCIELDRYKVRRWKEYKFKKEYNDIFDAIINKNSDSNMEYNFNDKPVFSEHLTSIIKIYTEKYGDKDLYNTIDKLRDIEKIARNVAAHEIISIDDEWIKNKVNISSKDIIKLILKAINSSGMRINNLDSYEKMNAILEKEITK